MTEMFYDSLSLPPISGRSFREVRGTASLNPGLPGERESLARLAVSAACSDAVISQARIWLECIPTK